MNYKILSALTLIIAALPVVIFAQTPPPFETLVGIPGVEANSSSIGDYINTLYTLSISIAGLLAVIKIIIAGAKYMLSDMVTSKSDAKKDIQGALIGLLIVISAVVILQTINPQLRLLDIAFTPASTVPGREVRDTPTRDNSAPLPGRIRGEEEEVIMCEGATCIEASNQCYNNNGRVESTWFSRADRITCQYGETISLYCSSELNSATQQEAPNCDRAINSCAAGSTYRQTSDYTGTCFTPFPPLPTANTGGDTGTRGGA